MRKTFTCDNSMIITIPLGSLRDVQEGRLMPEKFNCVFKDWYKVFVLNGKPRPLGAAQILAGVFLVILGIVFTRHVVYTLPSVIFVITGTLSIAAGIYPNMLVTKLSFSLNIISFFWSVGAFSLSLVFFDHDEVNRGISGLIMTLLVVENLIALFLIFWLSKAVCRQHFNSLPTILLKLGD